MRHTFVITPDPDRFKIRIEKNVPLPENDNPKGPQPVYPLRELEPGDSFTVPAHMRDSVSSLATRLGKKTGAVFTIRKVDPDTVRVWRIS